MALFRAGHEEAFGAIHDRYRQRLFAYTRQMLPGSRHDAEDALQDVFVRAYAGLRADHRQLALRAWLYRVAHNRCVDELRRPAPPAPELLAGLQPPAHDPIDAAERRESLRRLVADIRRLPDHQRSALLMRELAGMPYSEIAAALGTSVQAVKSLLVRARVNLAESADARNADCAAIREQLMVAHDRGVRPTGLARRHMRDCSGCREFRGEMRGLSRRLAAIAPAGALATLAHTLGLGGTGSFSGAGAAGGAGGAGAFAVGGGTAASLGAIGTAHVATLLAAAAMAAGGAVAIQQSIAGPAHRHHSRRAGLAHSPSSGSPSAAAVEGVSRAKLWQSVASAPQPPRHHHAAVVSSPSSLATQTPTTAASPASVAGIGTTATTSPSAGSACQSAAAGAPGAAAGAGDATSTAAAGSPSTPDGTAAPSVPDATATVTGSEPPTPLSGSGSSGSGDSGATSPASTQSPGCATAVTTGDTATLGATTGADGTSGTTAAGVAGDPTATAAGAPAGAPPSSPGQR